MSPMNRYALERMIQERHQAVIEGAEARSRLNGWEPTDRFAVRLATQLRRIADRLDGRVPARVYTPMFRRLDT
jgi:hypothetical protein